MEHSPAIDVAKHTLMSGGLILAVGTLAGLLAQKAKIPDVAIFLLTGMLIGPQALGLIEIQPALFRETNPAPVKFALSLFGLTVPRVRLPLVEIGEQTKRELAGIMARLCNDWSASMVRRIDKPLGAWRRAS